MISYIYKIGQAVKITWKCHTENTKSNHKPDILPNIFHIYE